MNKRTVNDCGVKNPMIELLESRRLLSVGAAVTARPHVRREAPAEESITFNRGTSTAVTRRSTPAIHIEGWRDGAGSVTDDRVGQRRLQQREARRALRDR